MDLWGSKLDECVARSFHDVIDVFSCMHQSEAQLEGLLLRIAYSIIDLYVYTNIMIILTTIYMSTAAGTFEYKEYIYI